MSRCLITRDDVKALALADELLKGQIVRGTWERFAPEMEPRWKKKFVEEHISTAGDLHTAVSLWQKADMSVVIAGHEVLLGLVSTHMLSARLEDPSASAEILSGDAAADGGSIAFVPGKVDVAERWLGPPEARPVTQII
jgi:hypothetical protein